MFLIGDKVRSKPDPSKSGFITAIKTDVNGNNSYFVRFDVPLPDGAISDCFSAHVLEIVTPTDG